MYHYLMLSAMTTKAELERQNKKLKALTDERILLLWSIAVTSLGLFVLITAPFINKWFGISFEDLALAKVALPSGYAICGIGLAIQLIDRIPEIVEAWRNKKG